MDPVAYRAAMQYDRKSMRRRSIRLPYWDYGEKGAYFVTICTRDRVCVFDDAPLRWIVEHVWRKVVGPGDGAGEFVVMPNHVHGIIWITREPIVEPRPTVRRGMRDGLDPGSLPVIVRTFKSATAKRINNRRRTRGSAVWQGDYYEHIIRDEADLLRIREYIIDNPRKWADDPHNPAVFMKAVGMQYRLSPRATKDLPRGSPWCSTASETRSCPRDR